MNAIRILIIVSIVAAASLISLLYWEDQTDSTSSAGELVFYCAAGMRAPVEAIRTAYEDEYGVEVQVQYQGSGTLLSNLSVAKRGDLYLAADQTYIDLAIEKGLLRETMPIAHIVPVIIVAKGNPKSITSIDDLLREDVSFALANPDAASVGRTTKELLEAIERWDEIESKAKVFKPTVNEVANDVKLGAVDAGVVWDAVAAQYPELEAVHSPAFKAGEMKITVGVLEFSDQPTEALKFARYLSARDKGLETFAEMGFRPVEGDKWAERPSIVFFSGTVNKPAIDQTIQEFAEREGVEVNTVYNGCGILVAQMKAGQRPDAYFACDVSFVKQVGDLFLDYTSLAKTDIVMVVQKDNPKNIQSLEDLTREGMKVGVCNEEQSALGYLTMRLLKDAGVYEGVRSNVSSEVPVGPFLVNQTETGSLDAAIVYEVNAHPAKDRLDIVRIDHPLANATQPYAVAQKSDHKLLMTRLLDAIRSHSNSFEEVGFDWLGGEGDDRPLDEWTSDKVRVLSGEEQDR